MTDSSIQKVHQIEYGWHPSRDMSPMATSMSRKSMLGWDAHIRAWVRHPNVEEPSESVRYQVFPDGAAALAWRYRNIEAAEAQGGLRGRPLVSRVLIGDLRALSPDVAVVLCRNGPPLMAGPRPGEVVPEGQLPMIDAAELAELARDATEVLDDEASLEPGLSAVVAAALADPDTPLAISVREPQVYLPLARGSQALLLWGLWRIVWPILGVVRRGWSFSTFEPPLGYVDPRTLPDIVFRSARPTQTAPPATPRNEIRVLTGAVLAPAPGTFHDELAEWLVAEYREVGGDELGRRIAELVADQPPEARLMLAHDRLAAKWSPAGTAVLAPEEPEKDADQESGQEVDHEPYHDAYHEQDIPEDVGRALPLAVGPRRDNQDIPELSGSSQPPFSMSDLLERLAVVQGVDQFESLLHGVLAPPFQPDSGDRQHARTLMGDNNCYVPVFRRYKYEPHIYELARINCLIVIPDLDLKTVRDEVASWAYRGERAVVAGLLAAARDSGDQTWHVMREILEPVLAELWIADRGLNAEWSPGPASSPDRESWRGGFGRRRRG